jgi:MIP family channel proteins
MLDLIIAEALGAFILTFVGGAAILADTGLVAIAFAHGLGLMVAIYTVGYVSGCHANPAVSISLWLTKHLETRKLLLYVLSQCFGAFLAAVALIIVFKSNGELGVLKLAPGVTVGRGVLTEALLTFLLVLSVYGTAVDKRAVRGFSGLVIGLTLTGCIMAGGTVTGAALNPARAFGPALVAMEWKDHMVYWAGPIVGGVLAAMLYKYLLAEDKKR